MLILTAFVLGMRHALDPDHLVAVSTLVAEQRRIWPAARLGLLWGLGHLLPIAALGLPLVALRLHLPETWEHSVDLGVGVLLVLLGLRTLVHLRRERVHFHIHEHDGSTHPHFHGHRGSSGHDHVHPTPARSGLVSFSVGVMHGLAGSGAGAVLAMTASPSTPAASAYLVSFGLGTVLGMFVTTLFVAAPALLASRWSWAYGAVRVAAGLASIGVGFRMWLELLPYLL